MTMPNFLIIGTAKAGTTSLYHYLKQHPEIYMSPKKEPRFFAFEGRQPDFKGPGDQIHINTTTITGIDDYKSLFSNAKREKAIGEASVIYLYYSEAASVCIKHYIPDAKLIAILRDPVDRAFSAFTHLVRDGHERLTDFERAIEEEDRRVRDNWTPMWHYTRRGLYYDQLRRYFQLFDRERIGVWIYEDFKSDPFALLGEIFRFLEVDDSFTPDTSLRYNPSGIPKNRPLQTTLARLSRLKPYLNPRLSDAATRIATKVRRWNMDAPPQLSLQSRARLIEIFRPDIEKLQELIGRDFSAWLR